MSSPPPSFAAHPELPDGVEPLPVPPAAGPPAGLAAVPAWVPFVALVVAFVGVSIASLLIGGLAAAAGADVSAEESPPGLIIGASIIQGAALIGAAILFARLWGAALSPATFGLRTTPFWRAVGWTAAIYVAFWVLAAIYGAIIGETPDQDLVNDLRDEKSIAVLVGFALLVSLVAPIGEEFFFRGFLYGVLRERIGVVAGIVVAGSVFGLIHVAGTPIQALGILVVLGVGLCVLYERTGSLIPGMALHSLHNSISFTFTVKPDLWVVLLLILGAPTLVVLGARAVSRRSAAPPAAVPA